MPSPSRLTRLVSPAAALLLALAGGTIPVTAQSPSVAPSCAPTPSAAPLPASSGEPTTVPAGDLVVFAAASLATPFADLQAPWAAVHPG